MEETTPSTENVTLPATSPATSPSTPVWRMTGQWTFALIGVAVLIIGALAIPRRLPLPGANAPADRRQARVGPPAAIPPISAPVPPAQAMTAAPVEVWPSAAAQAVKEPSKKAAASKIEKHRIAESPKSAAAIGAATPLAELPGKEDFATMLAAPEPVTATRVPASASTGTTLLAPVTIIGCLEISANEDAFRLTKTEGVDAPKSRSWRTGFLKRRSAPVVLVEPPDPLVLQMEVGKRVAASGQLTSRELKVSSLRVVGPSCN